jgi:hypothetical protein
VKIAQISNAGLWAMGILVAVLWGFIVADRLLRRRPKVEESHSVTL